MSGAIELLDHLRGHGIQIWTDGDRIHYRAATGALTPQLAREIKQYKAELIHHLGGQPYCEISHAQRRMWILSQIEAASAAYNVPVRFVLDGALERDALLTAVAQLVSRHEALRTTFVSVQGEPYQVIQAPGIPSFREIDIGGERHPEEWLRAFLDAEASEPFDLERGPLFRMGLVQVCSTRHVLFLTTHHIVCDGWSIRVIMKDLAAFYEAAVANRAPGVTPLRLQYRDYAGLQNRALRSGELSIQQNYWLAKLAGELPILNLPLDFARPPFQSFHGSSVVVRFDPGDARDLRAFARSRQSSVFSTLTALIKVLLHRYTGQTDIIVGAAVAGRGRLELENQVGCYLNTLALRDRIDPCASFDWVAREVRQSILGALDHQDYPFDHLIEILNLPRDLSRSPLFDVMVVSQSAAELNSIMGSVRVSHLSQASYTSKFDLNFDCEEGDDFVQIGIEYNTALFAADRIACMGQHLRMLLRAALREPTLPIGRLPLLSEAEWNTAIRTRNRSEATLVRATMLERISDTMRRVPDATAIVCGTECKTFAQLESRAMAIAQSLRGRGVGPGHIVGVLVERSPDLVASLLGVMHAGAAYMPLDGMYPPQRLAAMLSDSGSKLILSDSVSRVRLPEGSFSVLCLNDLPMDATRTEFPGPPAPDSLAYLIYTSGSTGRPKGVQISHRALANFLESMEREPGLRAEDVLLAVTTVCFDIAALELFLPLCVGAKLVIASRETAADGRALVQLIRRTNATVLQATPTTWRMLIAAGWDHSLNLRAFCGGEALPRELSEQLFKRAKDVWNLYGPTETTVWSAVHRIGALPAGQARVSAVEPIGHPIANTKLYVLDDWLAPAPTGVPGELYIGGEGVARGYWNRPDLTAEKFLPDPFSVLPGARMYRTGDLFRATVQGDYEFLGRRDHQLKIRGFRIEPGDIESHLRGHPDITEAIVTARSDATGDSALTAYVVSRTGREPEGLHRFLANLIPAYMVPTAFVCLPTLPLTPNGKINRGALPSPPAVRSQAVIRVLPRTPVEKRLAALWQEVLGTDNPGIHDNFFELGGTQPSSNQDYRFSETRLRGVTRTA